MLRLGSLCSATAIAKTCALLSSLSSASPHCSGVSRMLWVSKEGGSKRLLQEIFTTEFVQLAYRLRGRLNVMIILLFYFWESLQKFSESCHLNQPNHTGSPSASTRSGQVRNTSFKQNPPTAILLTPDQHTPTGRDANDFVSINTLHYSEVFIFKFNYRKMFQSD